MNKLTAEKCRELIEQMNSSRAYFGPLPEKDEMKLQALEIALPVLEGKASITKPTAEMFEAMGEEYIRQSMAIMRGESNTIFIEKLATAFLNATPQIDNDGWINWEGGTNPLGDNCLVKIRLRDTVENEGFAGDFTWRHGDYFQDIIAYRVIENDGREG